MRLDELLAPDPRYSRSDAPNRILMASSLMYMLPMLAALKMNSIYTAAVCGNLVVTSFIYHMTKDVNYFWVDQVAVYLYVVAAVYESFFKRKMLHQIIVAAVSVYAITIYHYGYLNQCYIWDSDCSLSSAHHAGMHIISALAGAITFLTE